MKIALLALLFSLVSAQKDYDIKNLVIFEDKFLIKFSDEIVNGDVYTNHTGILVKNGNIVRGVKDGKWTEWYDKGTKKLEFTFLGGFLVGPVKMWNEAGKLIVSGNYIKGNGTTIMQNIDPNSFPTNGRDGIWNFYYEDGTIKLDEEWIDGILVSEKEYYKNSKSIKYEAYYGVKNPDPDKKVLLEYIGSIDVPVSSYAGLKTYYYKSGEIYSIQQWDWVQNRPYGKSSFFHETGEIWMKVQYNDKGKKHGYLEHYFLGKLYKRYFYNKDHIVHIETYNLKGEIDYKTDCMLKYCKEPTLATID